MSKLKSRKREMFAIEVAAMTPLDRAYVQAGYSDTIWARYNASKLAHVPEVANRIDELRKEFSARSGIHAEYIQRKLLPVIEANPQDLYEIKHDSSGHNIERLRAISEMPRNLAAAIQKVKLDPETGTVVEVAFYSKVEGANVLLRSVGAIKEAEIRNVNGTVNLSTRLDIATARANLSIEDQGVLADLLEGLAKSDTEMQPPDSESV
jgi:terminase small subunit-like protein